MPHSVISKHTTHIISSTAPTYAPHYHPGFVDRPRRRDCTAGKMDGEAGWWTTNGNIRLPPLARVMGVGRQHNLDIITQVSREYGHEINSEKSCVMIFNVRERSEHLCNIKVVQKMKFFEREIDNQLNYFKTQRGKIIQNSRKMANITYSMIEKSCNKLLNRKRLWKSIALPSLLYGTNIIHLTDDNIRELQKIENSVYRCSTLQSKCGY